jgi:hypothetical protein
VVNPEREITERISQHLCKQLELCWPLRPVLNHGNLAALIGKWHSATRYIPFEQRKTVLASDSSEFLKGLASVRSKLVAAGFDDAGVHAGRKEYFEHPEEPVDVVTIVLLHDSTDGDVARNAAATVPDGIFPPCSRSVPSISHATSIEGRANVCGLRGAALTVRPRQVSGCRALARNSDRYGVFAGRSGASAAVSRQLSAPEYTDGVQPAYADERVRAWWSCATRPYAAEREHSAEQLHAKHLGT